MVSQRTSQRQLQLTKAIAIPLSITLIATGALVFTGTPESLRREGQPLFTTTRVPAGDHFVDERRRDARWWAYAGFHAGPGIVWCVVLPLQHVDALRKRWPALHRSNGYLALFLSLIIGLSGQWVISKKMTYSHEDFLHLHSFPGLPLLKWPTFAASTAALLPIFLYTMYKAARTAQNRDLVRHRNWAVAHTLTGYVIAMERVSILMIYVVGWILTLFPTDTVQQFFDAEDTVESKSSAEIAAFAFANALALLLSLVWATYEWNRMGTADPARAKQSNPAFQPRKESHLLNSTISEKPH